MQIKRNEKVISVKNTRNLSEEQLELVWDVVEKLEQKHSRSKEIYESEIYSLPIKLDLLERLYIKSEELAVIINGVFGYQMTIVSSRWNYPGWLSSEVYAYKHKVINEIYKLKKE